MINIILHTYFGFNIFFFGAETANSRFESRTLLEATLQTIIVLLFGLIIYGIGFLWEQSQALWHYANGVFQIKFFFQFNFSKTYHNLDTEALLRVSKDAANRDDSTYNRRRFKRCVAKINKRNNFTYIPAPKSETEF